MLLEFHGRQSVHPLEGRDRPIVDRLLGCSAVTSCIHSRGIARMHLLPPDSSPVSGVVALRSHGQDRLLFSNLQLSWVY
jgi:hypothetical protein